MGTRNMTMVIDQEGTEKVAQYGQWDGYPSGVGAGILKFCKDQSLMDGLKSKLSKVRFIDKEGIDKEFMDSYNKNCPEWSSDPDNRTEEQIRWFRTYCSRDLADEILTNIVNSEDDEILLLNRKSTALKDGLVEWSYVINLKENTLTVYEHLDGDPIKIYDLNSLPEEKDFVKELEGVEEES